MTLLAHLLFADDTKLGNRDDTHENVTNIQADLNRLVNWADTWKMTFNVAV